MSSDSSTAVDFDFIRMHPLFNGISDEDLRRFQAYLIHERIEAGQTIIQEGEQGDCMYILLDGMLEVLKRVVSKEQLGLERIAILEAGDTFGEMEFIDKQSRSATVRVLEDCSVVIIKDATMWKVAEQDCMTFSRLLLNLAKQVSMRLRKTDAYFAGSLFSLRRR